MNLESIPLSNGVKMPRLGYGVYQVDPTTCEASVREALEVGYRAIDTAQAYHNEEGVGRAIKGSGLPREDIFLTTKVWVSNAGQEKARASIEESLRKLQTDYIDLLLIHQPAGNYVAGYRLMEKAYKEGKVRAIGLSNFTPEQVQEILVDIKKLITPPTSGEEEEIQPAPDGEIHIEVPVPDGQITVEVDKEEDGNSGIGGDIGDWDDETNVDIIV